MWLCKGHFRDSEKLKRRQTGLKLLSWGGNKNVLSFKTGRRNPRNIYINPVLSSNLKQHAVNLTDHSWEQSHKHTQPAMHSYDQHTWTHTQTQSTCYNYLLQDRVHKRDVLPCWTSEQRFVSDSEAVYCQGRWHFIWRLQETVRWHTYTAPPTTSTNIRLQVSHSCAEEQQDQTRRSD